MFTVQTFTNNKFFIIFNALIIAFAFFLQLVTFPGKVNAATPNLTLASIRYDTMRSTGIATNVQVLIKPSQTESSGGKLVINFGSATVTAGACTVNTSSLAQSATALPTSGTFGCWGSGAYVYITNVGALVSGTLYGINIATGVATGAAGTTTDAVTASTSGGLTQELSYVGSDFITNDLITVYATVSATFTMALSGNQDTFASNLSSGAVSVTNGVNATFATNATNGWNAFVKDTNAGLTSARAGYTIPTDSHACPTVNTLPTGTEDYVLWAASGTGSPTIAACFQGSATTGGQFTTTYQALASGSGPTAAQVVALKEVAAISPTTKAASDYTDVIEVVGAGNF